MTSKTKKIVITALLTALTCIATMIIKIPSPLNGYINLGDCVVLVAGWMLSPAYGFLAAGLGSALADVFSEYIFYAPATFIIKGLMALIVFIFFKLTSKKIGKFPSQLIGAFLAELFMISGYFLFEGILYGFAASVVNIPANAIQAAAGIILSIILIRILDKTNINK